MRRRSLVTLAALSATTPCLPLLPRRAAAQSGNLQPLQAEDALVLLVPGFLAQMYAAASHLALTGLDAEVRGRLREVPLIGERLADSLPKLRAPLPDGAAVSFYTQQRRFDALKIRYQNIASLSGVGFSTQQGVQANAHAIQGVLEGLRSRKLKRVFIVSHSKGGLDTLEALLDRESLWNNPVAGWIALQAPFAGSPVALRNPVTLARNPVHRAALQKLSDALTSEVTVARALEDLTVEKRTSYMSARSTAIGKLTAALRVRSCYTKYAAALVPAPGIPEQGTRPFAEAVVNKPLLDAIAEGVAAATRQHPAAPERATSEAVAHAVKLVQERLSSEVQRTLHATGMMDPFNLAMREPNDGLVPVASTQLSGAVRKELPPDADHAAPVMIAEPFRGFWSTLQRDEQTVQLLAELASAARS